MTHRKRPGEQAAADVLANALPVVEEDETADADCAALPRTDMGNGARLVRRFGDHLMYVGEVGWHCWDGGTWRAEGAELRARHKAHEAVRAIRDEVKLVNKAAREAHGGWALESQDSRRITAMMKEAQPYVVRHVNDLDADPYLLNVANGTIELAAGDTVGGDGGIFFRNARPGDLLTRQCAVAYRPDAEAPGWQAFMEQTQPDSGARAFLQRFVGYLLCGLTVEQSVLLCWGIGSNGKSTFVDTISHILGTYATSLPFASLTYDDRRRGGEPTPDLVRLPGRRLVRASEPETGVRFSESMIKAMTSSEPIPARHMRQGFFDFYPQFTVILSFNPKPEVRGVDDGIWRRLKLLPWPVRFVDADSDDARQGAPVKDDGLMARLREEGSGILNWALDGWRAYQEMGLAVPEVVAEATKTYREESDRLSGFVASVLVRRVEAIESARDLYRAYCVYCRDNAQRPMSQTAFGLAMRERGFASKKTPWVHYVDVMLLDEWRFRLEREGAESAFDSDPGAVHN